MFRRKNRQRREKKQRSRRNKEKQRGATSTDTKEEHTPLIPSGVRRTALSLLLWLLGIIIVLSFFEQAGTGGHYLLRGAKLLVGEAVYAIPFVLLLAGAILLRTKYQRYIGSSAVATSLLILGAAGILGSRTLEIVGEGHLPLCVQVGGGGILGCLVAWPVLSLFEIVVAQIIFGGVLAIAFFLFWQLFREPARELMDTVATTGEETEGPAPVSIRPQNAKSEEEQAKPEKRQKRERKPTTKKEGEETGETKVATRQYRSGQEVPYPLDLLAHGKGKAQSGDIEKRKQIIEHTLDNFGISMDMGDVNVGPTVTQYTLKPAEGIKLSRITTLHNNLSLALAAHPLRIEAPIPGKPLVGIELPNKEREDVRLRDLMEMKKFQRADSPLTIAMGKNVSGTPVFSDLSRMPHMLVAGATGSGKTIFLNVLILSLLQKNTPEQLRFIMVDPKRVELYAYSDIPHQLSSVITQPDKTVLAIRWLISEMERRFNTLATLGARDIDSYNEKVQNANKKASNEEEKTNTMPYIVFVIDEMADLMAAKGKEIEAGIVRLAQMARAVGIHLVLATQRPSVEVLTGLIKANVTTRVALKVATQVDSRTILDQGGAERLLGAGDMLYISSQTPHPARVQSPFVSEKEVKEVAAWLAKYGSSAQDDSLRTSLEEALETESAAGSGSSPVGEEEEGDELYEEAKQLVVQANKASASLIQRRLRVGYARAARLIDILEENGVVGPQEGAKPRKVYGEPAAEEDEEGDGSDPRQREF